MKDKKSKSQISILILYQPPTNLLRHHNTRNFHLTANFVLFLTCSDSNTFVVRVPSRFVGTSAYGVVINCGAKCIISTFRSNTWILTAVVLTRFIIWTISVSFAFSFATFFGIAKVVWLASACTENAVIVVICIGSTRIRITWIFDIQLFEFFS